ncbi:MAG: hypothetical protein WB217_13815, partial [Mesobacillus sp.]|uniref:hypothetical protein n=1 Tax=Mesobacillus sp. TaxID=2675271 RepID=UPI003C567ADF
QALAFRGASGEPPRRFAPGGLTLAANPAGLGYASSQSAHARWKCVSIFGGVECTPLQSTGAKNLHSLLPQPKI